MQNTGIIIKNSINNNLKYKAWTIGFIGIALLLVVGLTVFFCIMLINPEIKKESPDIERLKVYLGLVTYVSSVICLGININVFAFQSMAREKSRGSIESLLATPLKIRNLWFSKSIAVFIPGFIMAVVFGTIVFILLNFIYFIPRMGFVSLPWVFASSFIAAPLIYLSLSFLNHLVGLSGEPTSSNIIAQVFLPAFLTLMINLILHNILNVAAWIFFMANIGIFILIAIVVVFLMPRLNVERVVLS